MNKDYDYMILELFILNFYGFRNLDEYSFNMFKDWKMFQVLRECFPDSETVGSIWDLGYELKSGFNYIQD